MVHEHLIKWGKGAFDKGISLSHIENYLLKRGLKKHEALNALHEITSFERRMHNGAKNLRRVLFTIPILFLLILAGLALLYFAGIPK